MKYWYGYAPGFTPKKCRQCRHWKFLRSATSCTDGLCEPPAVDGYGVGFVTVMDGGTIVLSCSRFEEREENE